MACLNIQIEYRTSDLFMGGGGVKDAFTVKMKKDIYYKNRWRLINV
jgi:hypothetical protein